MSMILRDPFFRDLMLDDYDRRYMRPYRHHHHHGYQPVSRVSRLLDPQWPIASSFDHALGELQSVMNDVNDAIGQYQNSLVRDLESGGMKTTRTEDGTLQLAMDVSQFKPEEVNVRLCDDNLVVEAKTESSENESYHKAEFKRWMKLPQDVKHDAIKSTLTPDKKLLIEVPCHKPIQSERSRQIPIDIQKGAPAAAVEGDKGKQQEQQQNGGEKEKEKQKK